MSEENEIEKHSFAPAHAAQAGAVLKGDQCILISPSGRFSRKIDLNTVFPSREASSPGLFQRDRRGKIPSIPTGFRTDSRKLMSAVGIHRAHQAGICGSQQAGIVFSIAMSGEYTDNKDLGEMITYTGSGGKEGQKGPHTHDQTLEGRNLLLAKCCPVPVNSQIGGDAGDNWRRGVPIRVVRGAKMRLLSDKSFGPAEGYRYDGIYKIQMYWPTRGKDGHKVWQFRLQRDDRSPAPWTPEGQAWTARHCRVFRDQHNEKRIWYWSNARRIIEALHPDPAYGTPQGHSEYTEAMRKIDQEETIGSDIESLTTEAKRAVYVPDGNRVYETILGDSINRRIWRRLLNYEYQVSTGIHDYMSFIEVALTQPEFMCLLCNRSNRRRATKRYRDDLTVPLVRFASLHCLRCDYNVCLQCVEPFYSSGVKSCPNCLAEGAFERNKTLLRVYQAMEIEGSLRKQR
ncbi:PUA-like domain-containing protein [Dichotomocladium elegans]|nr:PUA-like domain-containing protein [Dichotomocladium elegans]